MFRNYPQHRFEGRIHEQITPSIQRRNPDASFMMSDVRINHYGYKDEVIQRKNKTQRNLLLLQETLREKPDEPFHLYNISVEWMRLGKVREALEGFRKSRMLTDPKTSYAHLLYKCEAKCHMALGQFEQGAAICTEGIEKYPGYTDLYHYLGIFHMNRSDFHQAKEAFANAVKTGPPSSGFHTEEGMGSYLSSYQLGLLHEASLDVEAAAECYLQAVKSCGTFETPLFRLFHLLRISGREADIVSLFLERLPIDNAEQAIKLIMIMAETGCNQAALQTTERYRHLLPFADATVHIAAHALLTGDLQMARMQLEQPHLTNLPHPDLLRIKVLLCSVTGELEKARSHWQQLAELLPEQQNGVIACLIGNRSPDNLLLDQGGLFDMRMAIKTAYSNSRHAAVNRIIDTWRDALANQDRLNPAGSAVLVRTLADFADRHLERLSQTSRRRELAYACRLVLPFEDGTLR
jgi:tetratricopeptide (TPR) repeat protein